MNLNISSWLPTEIQLPRLPGSKSLTGGGVVGGGPTDYFVILNLSWGCFGLKIKVSNFGLAVQHIRKLLNYSVSHLIICWTNCNNMGNSLIPPPPIVCIGGSLGQSGQTSLGMLGSHPLRILYAVWVSSRPSPQAVKKRIFSFSIVCNLSLNKGHLTVNAQNVDF